MLDLAVADDLRNASTPSRANANATPCGDRRATVDRPGVSDGGAHTKFFTGGRYPTEFLARIVREDGMLLLEHAHWRSRRCPPLRRASGTAAPCARARRPTSSSTTSSSLACLPTEVAHDLPGGEWRRVQRARGYRSVLVNGEVTIEDDRDRAHPRVAPPPRGGG